MALPRPSFAAVREQWMLNKGISSQADLTCGYIARIRCNAIFSAASALFYGELHFCDQLGGDGTCSEQVSIPRDRPIGPTC